MGRPLSLPARVALTLFGGVLVLQALALAGALWSRAQDTGAAAWPLPDRLAALVELMERSDPAARAVALRAVNGGADRIVLLADFPASAAAVTPSLGAGAALAAPYQRRLGARDLRVLMRGPPEEAARGVAERLASKAAGPDPERFAFAVRLNTGEVLLFEPGASSRRLAVSTVFLIVNLAAAAVVALIVLGLILSLLKPLDEIAGRARTFAGDLRAPPMPERGPAEARAVAAAFNAMRADMLSLIEARTRMLAAIAHDLKTYMARLRLRTALIDDPVQREKADADIVEVTALIENSLLVARGDSEQAEDEVLDLAAMLAELSERRGDPRVRLAHDSPAPVLARGDPRSVRRILDNLVDNALFYAGEAELRVVAQVDGARVEVSDRGPGLGDVDPEALFEPFVRGEASRSRTTGGSGLGLSIARTLARQMGGDLALAPRPGGGTVATLRLPGATPAPPP